MVTTDPSPSPSPFKRPLTILQNDAAVAPEANLSIPPQAPPPQPHPSAAVGISPKAAPAARPRASSRTGSTHWQRQDARAHRRRLVRGLTRRSRDLPRLHRRRADSRPEARPGPRRARAASRFRGWDSMTPGMDSRRLRRVGLGQAQGPRLLRISDSTIRGIWNV